MSSWILILYVNEILDRIFLFLSLSLSLTQSLALLTHSTLFPGVILSPPLSALFLFCFPLLGWRDV